MSRASFWEELKRRNVLRAAALYAGAAWLLVQIATRVFPFFDVPTWAVRWVVVASLLGLPLVLALSWFYELTPQGIRRESELDADPSIARDSRRLDRWIIAVLGLAVVVLLAELVVSRTGTTTTSIAVDKSIAVLPFANLSDDKSNAYFAQGIQDEILTRLSKIGALRVISRTSTERYASQPENLPEIAQRLGVAHVLEGSVQKLGDQVRINVQLIRAATDAHLWAETYDRKLDDVFGVEGEVAQAIAEALNTRLTGAEHQAMNAPTHDPRAYDAYLRGLARELSYSFQTNIDAVRLYEEAVKADPEFALAWAHLAIVKSNLYYDGFDHTAQSLSRLREAAENAMRLQPELGEAWLARGYYYYRGLVDFDAALAAFEQARGRVPNGSEISAAIAYVQRRQGRWDEALENLKSASHGDPQNVSYWMGIAEIEAATHHYDEAESTLDHAIELAPDNVGLRVQKVDYYQKKGDLDAAQKILDAMPSGPGGIETIFSRAAQLLYERKYVAMAQLMQQAIDRNEAATDALSPKLFAYLGAANRLGGDEASARAAFSSARERAQALRASGVNSADLAGALGVIEAALGNREAALEEGRRSIELTGKDVWALADAEHTRALIELLLGDTDAALDTLTRLGATPGGNTPGDLRFNPLWDPIRGDPRFQALIAAL
jgi:TolB-like protein/Tfp pilus assembly protein PilF